MKHLIDEITKKCEFDKDSLEELTIVIDALAGSGIGRDGIKEQLKDYEIHM